MGHKLGPLLLMLMVFFFLLYSIFHLYFYISIFLPFLSLPLDSCQVESKTSADG